jgi:hypothetical protein
MPNNLTAAERAANFVHDPETDRVVYLISAGDAACSRSSS